MMPPMSDSRIVKPDTWPLWPLHDYVALRFDGDLPELQGRVVAVGPSCVQVSPTNVGRVVLVRSQMTAPPSVVVDGKRVALVPEAHVLAILRE